MNSLTIVRYCSDGGEINVFIESAANVENNATSGRINRYNSLCKNKSGDINSGPSAIIVRTFSSAKSVQHSPEHA